MAKGPAYRQPRNPRRRKPRRRNPGARMAGPAMGSILPMTPGFEASRRGAADSLYGELGQNEYLRQLIPGSINMFKARQGTDIGYETGLLNQDLAGRGIYDSSVRPYLQMRDITVPHERASQEFALSIQEQLNQLANADAEARLGYNQTLYEAMLDRAGDVAQNMPLGLPGQFAGPRRQNRRGKRRKGKK